MPETASPSRMPLGELFPLALVFLLTVLQPMTAVFFLLTNEPFTEAAEVLWFLAWWLALWAWWYAYAARRRLPLILDMGWFLAAAWPVVVPYFVMRKEGWRGIPLLVIYAGLWIGAFVAYRLVYASVMVGE